MFFYPQYKCAAIASTVCFKISTFYSINLFFSKNLNPQVITSSGLSLVLQD